MKVAHKLQAIFLKSSGLFTNNVIFAPDDSGNPLKIITIAADVSTAHCLSWVLNKARVQQKKNYSKNM